MISQFNPQRLAEAASAQKEASHPATSVFVSASAGSGKTKILIDRILRLMLPYTIEVNGELVQVEPTSPERILCLTFTKAAAAEMMERLRRELSTWFKADEPSLVKKLESIGVASSPEVIKEARALLGKVLEASGGMKIQTIHSFCQSLLQRFPSESHLVPNFELIDDLTQNEHLKEGLEKALEKCGDDDFRTLLKHYEASTIEEYIFGLCKQLANDPNSVVDESIDREFLKDKLLDLDIIKDAQGPTFENNLKNGFAELKSAIAGLDKPTDSQRVRFQELIDAEVEFLKDPEGEWFRPLVTLKGEYRKPPRGKTITEDFTKAFDRIAPMFEQAAKAFDFRQTLPFASLFAMITLETFKHAQNLKQAFHHLTYGDLLLHTRDLLENVEEAWVRYKLDGGIDHILLDEVQDNSELQWKIVRALRDEFFENTEEANKRPRTIFEVGDFKQSIYSFQGAEPTQFFKEKKLLQETAAKSLSNYTAPELQFSFRTHQPLLDFVNATFLGIDEEQKMEHFNAHKSIKSAQSGRVEVWPLITPQTLVAKDEDEEDNETAFNAACMIANFIKKQLDTPPNWLTGRSLKPEDIMILVRKRGNPDFLALLESLLKRQGIPTVNGAKFNFKEHVVVQDLMALCRILLLPADNLSVAKVLLSPVGGLDHKSLNDLILENGKPSELDINSNTAETLWQLLWRRHEERHDWTRAYKNISELWSKVDYDSPYTLLSRALGACGGYDRYCARFGKEVFEILDAFLNFALEFEAQHVSSLEGFVNWFDTENLELKREDLKTAKAVQLMTVHAAKGLESKMVILADVPGKGMKDKVALLPTKGSSLPVVLSLTKGSTALNKIQEEEDVKEQREIDRLLYVALTRPVEWFVCVGWGKQETKETRPGAPIRWLDRCKNALLSLKESGDKRIQSEEGILVLNGDNVPVSASAQQDNESISNAVLPAWIVDKEKLSCSDALIKPLRPSKPEGAEFGIRPFSFSPLTGEVKEGVSPRKRGILVHMLLQLLPDVSEDKREAFANRWASLHMKDLKAHDREKIISNCLAILNNAEIKPLFSADASVEQPVSGIFNGHAVLGRIDRVLITDDEIWLADYKTGRPYFSESYKKQLQIYARILKDIKPNAKLHVFLIWTQTAQVQEISNSDLSV